MPEYRKYNNSDHPEVHVRRNESVDRALKRLKRKLDKEGFRDEIRKRKHYEKPSKIKHENRKRMQRRNKRNKHN